MPRKRFLSLWFPRLAAERLARLERGLAPGPLAVVADQRGAQVLASLNAEAEAAGLYPGQPLRDARAICPELASRPANPLAEAGFLTTLRRWAGKFTPWVSQEPPAALVLDITGCAHLFGGEDGLVGEIERDCAGLGLTVRLGIADTVGAAWALARYAGAAPETGPAGDAIDQEARATRSRAAKRRHWTRGGAPPRAMPPHQPPARIAPVGSTRSLLAPLPVAALRIDADIVEGLTRLGLRRIGDILGTPRAGLARRFGTQLVRRLDQALGIEPEPVSPARPPVSFGLRLRLPDPIGLEDDLAAALDRLLPELEARLTRAGRGARRVRAAFSRTDRTMQAIEIGLARPTADPERIRPLLVMKLADIDAGLGIDQVRLSVPVHEPVSPEQHRGHLAAGERARRRDGVEIDDLMGRIGARLGLAALTRLHPAESHIPEKAAIVMAAAFVAASRDWHPGPERPLRLWPPEPVMIPPLPHLPGRFRWRGRDHGVAAAEGPERIAPEWWLDDPAWRTGQRDYWRVTTDRGERLWLYFAHGAALSAGWFCHGAFA
jgi:protein ImuB